MRLFFVDKYKHSVIMEKEMTVQELIDALSTFPPDQNVTVYSDDETLDVECVGEDVDGNAVIYILSCE